MVQEIEDLFFKTAESRQTLPEDCNAAVVDSFVGSLVSVVSFNQNQRTVLRALKLFFLYLKNDPNVYARFKPMRLIIRAMNIE